MDLKIDLSQAIILRLVSGNRIDKKVKNRIKIFYNKIKWLKNIIAFKLIAKQKANKKAWLKKYKVKQMIIFIIK